MMCKYYKNNINYAILQIDNNIFVKNTLFQRVKINRIDEISNSISSLENKVQSVEKSVNLLNMRTTSLEAKMISVENNINFIRLYKFNK